MHPLNDLLPNCQSWLFKIIKWSILIQWIRVMIDGWQCDLVNKKESILPVCDTPYHTNKQKVQKGEEIKVLRNCALIQAWAILMLQHPPHPCHTIGYKEIDQLIVMTLLSTCCYSWISWSIHNNDCVFYLLLLMPILSHPIKPLSLFELL